MKWLRFVAGLVVLVGFIALLATGPTPGPVLQHNLDQEIQATALFYMDFDEMQNLERRLETLLEEKEQGPAEP
jgi:hypothetical protein